MTLTSSALWLSLLIATSSLVGCGSDFTANGVSTGGTGGQVPDLGEDDLSLPDDSALVAPNPAIPANQANQLPLLATDVQWTDQQWRLIQTAEGIQISPDFFENFATQLGDKPEGILTNPRYAVLFGSNANQSFYQILSINTDGEPVLSAAKAINGRIVHASLNSTDTLDLWVEDYTGQTSTVGSTHVRLSIQAGQGVEPMLSTRLATKPLASATNQQLTAWIGANKGGTQWLYVQDCPSTVTACLTPTRPTMLAGKLPANTLLLRGEHQALFIRENRIYVQLVGKKGEGFVLVYTLQDNRLTLVEQTALQGTAVPLVTTDALAAPQQALSKFVFGGGGGLPPAANPSTQSALLPTTTTWQSLRVQQNDEQLSFYPNSFAAPLQHRIVARSKAEGLYPINDVLLVVNSTNQDTILTLIAPNGSLDALTTSSSRSVGRLDQLRVQSNAQTQTVYLDELLNQNSSSKVPAYFARSLIDPVTKTKGAAKQRALPASVLASAATEQWMVWLGQDADQQLLIYPIFCTTSTDACVHASPVKVQGQLMSESVGLRRAHPDVKILKDRLFIYSMDGDQRYLSVYAFEQNQLILVKRSLL